MASCKKGDDYVPIRLYGTAWNYMMISPGADGWRNGEEPKWVNHESRAATVYSGGDGGMSCRVLELALAEAVDPFGTIVGVRGEMQARFDYNPATLSLLQDQKGYV